MKYENNAVVIKDDTGTVKVIFWDHKTTDPDGELIESEPPAQEYESGRVVVAKDDLPANARDKISQKELTESELPVSLDRVGPPDFVPENPGIGPDETGPNTRGGN